MFFMSETERKVSLKAVFAILFYLVIPAIAIYIIMETYPELSKDRFINMINDSCSVGSGQGTSKSSSSEDRM